MQFGKMKVKIKNSFVWEPKLFQLQSVLNSSIQYLLMKTYKVVLLGEGIRCWCDPICRPRGKELDAEANNKRDVRRRRADNNKS